MDLKYFGTDGIRGRAYASPLTLEEAGRWGQAWAQVARARGIDELIIGWDPRLSSEPLAEAFVGGLEGRLRLCVMGLVPTPAVAYAAATRPGAWGLVISASLDARADVYSLGIVLREALALSGSDTTISPGLSDIISRPAVTPCTLERRW